MSFQEVIKEYYILPSVIILCFPAIFPFNNYQFQVPDNFKISRIWSYPRVVEETEERRPRARTFSATGGVVFREPETPRRHSASPSSSSSSSSASSASSLSSSKPGGGGTTHSSSSSAKPIPKMVANNDFALLVQKRSSKKKQ